MKDKRVLIVFAVVIAVMAGIFIASRNGSNSKTDNAADSQTATTSTIAVPQTTTTVFNSNDGKAILEHIISVQNDILEHPSVTRINEIMDPTCSCFGETRQGVQTLIDKNWHVQGDTLQVRTVAVLNDTPTEKKITATFVRTKNPTVDANGTVQQQPTASFTDPLIFTIKKNADGVWLVYNRTSPEERKS